MEQSTRFKTLTVTPEGYTTTLGAYCEWNRNVDLGTPHRNSESSQGRSSFKPKSKDEDCAVGTNARRNEMKLSCSAPDLANEDGNARRNGKWSFTSYCSAPDLANEDGNVRRSKEIKELGKNNDKYQDAFLKEDGHQNSAARDDQYVHNYYDALQYALYETNYPETDDRTNCPRTKLPDSGISIVLLSSPVECLAILLEGGNLCPNDMLLVMSSSWLETRPSDIDATLKTLYVHKAITFESAGRTYLDIFKPARKVTYLMNFFTRSVTDGQRNDGADLEKDLDCPMSSSVALVKWTDDKLWTRILMAKKQVKFPETLAFCSKPSRRYEVTQGDHIEIVKLPSDVNIEKLVGDRVQTFVESLPLDCTKIVVKPSGIMWHGSRGVAYHKISDVKQITRNVVELIKQLDPDDGVLVEVFHAAKPEAPELEDLSFRIRTTVCRSPQDKAITTTIVCCVGYKSCPINGDASALQSLETTLLQWGLTDLAIQDIRAELEEGSARVLEAIIEQELIMSDQEQGGAGAQTDLIGIDYVLGIKNGKLVPIGIEVNSHDCTINCQIYEFLNTEIRGQSVSPLIATMCDRSQRYLMQGKIIVVIGESWFQQISESLINDFSIKFIMVGDQPNSIKSNNITFLQYNLQNQDQNHLHNISSLLKDQRVDGCCCFIRDYIPLTSNVCNTWCLIGMENNTAAIVNSTKQVHDKLASRTGDIPHFPRTNLYSLKCLEIINLQELLAGFEELGFPCVLKSEGSSSSIKAKVIYDKESGISAYKEIGFNMDSNINQIILMPYVKGSEHDVTAVIFRRKLLKTFVSDKTSTKDPEDLSEKSTTSLRPDQIGQIRIAAYQCCTEIGLTHGVFTVKMIMSTTGSKLIKIYPCITADIYHKIKALYQIDLLKCYFMIACGIKPFF